MTDLDASLISPARAFENDLVFIWSKKFENKSLTDTEFKEHWVKNVPLVFDPTSGSSDEKVLFTPLEQFICGSNDSTKVFEQLKMLNDTPSFCGKVFKAGEPTYSCRQCGLDPTCVLCVDCFTNSEHKNHRYKMCTSGGGGYCDCGDEEAWKYFSYCNNHHGKSSNSEDSSPVDRLPPDLVERFRLVLRTVLKYTQTMLTWAQVLNLPADLIFPYDTDKKDYPDTYTTILYNDETHTYEQVIDTLTKAINCSKKVAIDYATAIDREGRSIVKCANFAECNQVRHFVERVTSRLASKLKVSVLHTEIVSHQTFALKLLNWLQNTLAIHKGFCHIFTEEILENDLLGRIMCADTSLWKTARNQWHQLFITGMLMDMKCKKEFAKNFIKHYSVLMKDFIADDHDHAISVTSLSVQIFTVPTLAHFLIEEHDALHIILKTFNTECQNRHLNATNKLFFQRNLNNNTFRRAQYMLFDLSYLVAVPPTQWGENTRKNFLRGLAGFFSLLEMMQDMDPVVRQVGQHVEYEAEWESGINLQLRIAPLVTLLLRLCYKDYNVFVKAMRSNIRHFVSTQSKTTCIGVELANHSASCIHYDIGAQPVSIHLPLVRFMAGLMLRLEQFNLSYNDPQFQVDHDTRPSPELLMELPLRTLVMLAQFRAGMWRRNGYSLLNQVYFYHNVRLRDEMFDRDILMLQISASMIESNEFLIHLIYKYGLLNWAAEDFDGTPRKPEEDNIRQIITVAEEFLSIVLIILSERFTPYMGQITEAERVKKEIIQLLCMEPMPHSQLFKLLPKDPSFEVSLESVVKEVANFKMPNGPGVGKYELKAEYYKCFNPFYYHYTREEQSKAEEVQMKRRKQLCEEVCCPPPVPPEFTPRFAIISNILQCDVMLHIMELVLKRTPNLHSAAFSETQLEKVLHLIGLALHEEERAVTKDKENAYFLFTSKATKRGFPELLDECLKCPRVDVCGEPQKDLISWVIAKFKHVESLHVQTPEQQPQDTDMATASTSTSKNTAKDRKRKTEMAAARRTRIMAQMSAMQKSFLREHADMFKETILEDNSLSKSSMDINAEGEPEDPVCFTRRTDWRKGSPLNVYTCILCREDQELSCSGRSLVLSAFVQRSSILSKNKKRQMKDSKDYDPLQLPADLFWSTHVSTCGHVMHSDCWQKFFDSVVHKEQRRPVRFSRHTSFDVEKKEFLCPLCERLSNSVIPLIPPLSNLVTAGNSLQPVDISIDDWLGAMQKVCDGFVEKMEHTQASAEGGEIKDSFPCLYKTATLAEATANLGDRIREKFSSLFSIYNTTETQDSGFWTFSQNVIDMMKLFSEAVYTVGFNTDININDTRVAAMSWSSCIYTIHAMEWLLRDKGKALFGSHSARNALCLDGIIRLCGASLRIFNHNVVRTNGIRLLRYLLLGDHFVSNQCCLDMDAFSVLVFLVLSFPVLFESPGSVQHPLGTTLDRHVLHVMLVFHFVQVLLTYPFHQEEDMETDNQTSLPDPFPQGESVSALLFYEEVRTAAGLDQSTPAPSGHTIVHCLKTGSLPFLRCAAIFFHVLTDTPASSALQEVGENEFESICTYLGLQTALGELLASPFLKHFALSWARHPRILHLLENPEPTESDSLVRHPVSINKLVSLPADYSDLINSVSQFTCPNSEGDDSRNPTMCLVCGEVLCSQSYCCQIDLNNSLVGACTHHAYYCGSGVGIFLRIRDCKILLLSDKNKGCFTAPPYVDEYGETDQGLFRGNPLHLCQERYEELNELWLSHNIPEKVSHNMELSTTLPNWQLL